MEAPYLTDTEPKYDYDAIVRLNSELELSHRIFNVPLPPKRQAKRLATLLYLASKMELSASTKSPAERTHVGHIAQVYGREQASRA